MNTHLPGTTGSEDGMGVPDNNQTTQTTDFSSEIENDEPQTVTEKDSQTKSEDSSKTPEQLEHERRQAVKASLASNHKAKEAQAQSDRIYTTLVDTAKRNPDGVIPELYSKDPELADRICNDLYGMSYQDAVAAAQKQAGIRKIEDDIPNLIQQEVDRRLKEKESASASMELEEFQEEMFMELAQKYAPTSFQFKKVRDEYKSLGTPSNKKQAKAFFDAARRSLVGDDGEGSSFSTTNIPSISLRGDRQGDNIPMPSAKYFEAAKAQGYSRETALKAWKRTMESSSSI